MMDGTDQNQCSLVTLWPGGPGLLTGVHGLAWGRLVLSKMQRQGLLAAICLRL